MSDQFLLFVNQYGLPAWGVLIIGAGTIVAAIITAIQALIVALINAWAAQRVATYNAHRERRATLAAASLKRVHAFTPLAIEIERWELEDPHTEIDVRTQATTLNDRLASIKDELGKEPPLFIPPPVRRIWSFVRRSVVLLEVAVDSAAGSEPSANMQFHRVQMSAAAERWLAAASAYEYEAEAYVFGLSSLRLRARWTVAKFHVRAWWKRRRKIAVK